MAQCLAGHDIEELNVRVQVVPRVFRTRACGRCLLQYRNHDQLVSHALDIVGEIDTHKTTKFLNMKCMQLIEIYNRYYKKKIILELIWMKSFIILNKKFVFKEK